MTIISAMMIITKYSLPTIDFATRYSTRYSDFLLQPYSNPTRSKRSLLVCAWLKVIDIEILTTRFLLFPNKFLRHITNEENFVELENPPRFRQRQLLLDLWLSPFLLSQIHFHRFTFTFSLSLSYFHLFTFTDSNNNSCSWIFCESRCQRTPHSYSLTQPPNLNNHFGLLVKSFTFTRGKDFLFCTDVLLNFLCCTYFLVLLIVLVNCFISWIFSCCKYFL